MITLSCYLDWRSNESVTRKDFHETITWSLLADFAIGALATLAVLFA